MPRDFNRKICIPTARVCLFELDLQPVDALLLLDAIDISNEALQCVIFRTVHSVVDAQKIRRLSSLATMIAVSVDLIETFS